MFDNIVNTFFPTTKKENKTMANFRPRSIRSQEEWLGVDVSDKGYKYEVSGIDGLEDMTGDIDCVR